MRAAANPPWSLFIVQAWMEGADPKSFRARIKQISHLGSTTVVSATSSPAELGVSSLLHDVNQRQAVPYTLSFVGPATS